MPMFGDFDLRLVDFLRGSMGFTDALRDIGLSGRVSVNLAREEGLRLLKLVQGVSEPSAEEWSQRGRPLKPGWNSLSLAGITFEWPRAMGALRHADNDNCDDGVDWFGMVQ